MKEKINIEYLKVRKTKHTGMAFTLVNDKTAENMIVVAPGSNMESNMFLAKKNKKNHC